MQQPTESQLEEWASWFKCLADPTRLKIFHFVAVQDEPTTVGAVVDAVGRSQSTVSRHLQVLAEDRFVFLEPDGVRTLVRANPTCMTELPDAASALMGLG
jgi:ArsR family transcriptional regulator